MTAHCPGPVNVIVYAIGDTVSSALLVNYGRQYDATGAGVRMLP